MARRHSSSTSAALASGRRLPVLALRRDGRDATLLQFLLGASTRIELDVVRPDGLVRTPLRWPADARTVPLALCVVVRDRPGSVKAVDQLVRQVGEVPVVAVVDSAAGDDDEVPATEDHALVDMLLSVGVEAAVLSDGLTAAVLEHVVIAAIDRRDRGVLHLDESELLVEEGRLTV